MGKNIAGDILWNGSVTSVTIIFLLFNFNCVVSTYFPWVLGLLFFIVALLGSSILHVFCNQNYLSRNSYTALFNKKIFSHNYENAICFYVDL